jgi:IS30 family transposase
MTFDNGKEFSGHQTLAKVLGVSCFFANPYHSWERGLNEHTNGLLRQFFPKGTNFKTVKPEQLQQVVDLISVEGLIPRRLRRTELQRPKGVVERSRTAKRVRQSDSIPRLLAAGFFIHRPRKSLDYRTPDEVLLSHSSVPVALQF